MNRYISYFVLNCYINTKTIASCRKFLICSDYSHSSFSFSICQKSHGHSIQESSIYSCYSIYIFSDIIKYSPVKGYFFFFHSYIMFMRKNCAILVFLVYISVHCINQFWNMVEIGCIWWNWDAIVVVNLFIYIHLLILNCNF